MAIRSREQRKEDAERILAEYRARLSGSAGEDRQRAGQNHSGGQLGPDLRSSLGGPTAGIRWCPTGNGRLDIEHRPLLPDSEPRRRRLRRQRVYLHPNPRPIRRLRSSETELE